MHSATSYPAQVSRVKESVPSTSFALMAQNNKAVSTPMVALLKSVRPIAAVKRGRGGHGLISIRNWDCRILREYNWDCRILREY